MMTKSLVAAVLLVAPADVWARADSPTEVKSERLPEGVAVKIDPEVPDSEITRGWVEDRVRVAVERLETPIEEGALMRIVVKGAPFDYRVSVTLLRDGEALPREHQPEPVTCSCGSEDMLEKVAEMVELGASTIAAVAKQQREQDARERAQAQIEREKAYRLARDNQPDRRDEVYRPTALGRSGIALIGVGATVGLTGVVIAAQGDEDVRAGVSVLGAGSAVLLGGVTMLVVDAVRCRRDRSRCDGRRFAGEPARWAWRPSGGVR